MSDIDYGGIIKRSWNLTWNNKWLWVPGMVLAVFAGGGSSGGGGGSGSSSSAPYPSASPIPTNFDGIRDQTTLVLGEATNALKDWFYTVPNVNWALIILLIVVFFIFSLVIKWILTSWAKGALISGLDDADRGKPVSLKSISPTGISKIKDLIVFNLISIALVLSAVLGLGVVVGIGFLVKLAIPLLGVLWIILFGLLGFLAFLVGMIFLIMLTIYAERLIVLKHYRPWDAWKKGLSLSKGNFIQTFLMGLINSVIGCFTGCLTLVLALLVMGLPAYLLIKPIFTDGFHMPGIGQIIGLVVLFVLFTTILTLTKAVFIVFDNGNWNLLFKDIFKEK